MQHLTDHAPLLGHDELERLQGYILERRDRRRAVSSLYNGPALSHHRGHGMDLHDVRPYQPGDDIRHMDWRATARSNKPTTKVFLEERQHSLLLVVDRRPTMRFGTKGELKAASAARAASIMAFTALAARERVSGLILENTMIHYPSARTLEGVLPLVQAAAAPLRISNPAPQIPFHAIYEQLFRHAERGTTVYLISDFHDVDEQHATALSWLAERFETLAIRIVDPAEISMQGAGRMRITSPISGKTVVIDTDDSDIRHRYDEKMTQRTAQLQRLFAGAGIQFITIHNNKDIFQQLNPIS